MNYFYNFCISFTILIIRLITRFIMDKDLHSKLPCGGGLWNYKYPAYDKYVQKTYENIKTSNPIKLQLNTSESNNAGVNNKDKNRRSQSLINFIIKQIDPLSTLYTRQMFDQAEEIFRERLSDFVSKGSGHQWLGPKKSRTLLAWVTHNNHGVADEMGKIITDFLSWFLDMSFKYIPEHSHFIVESKEEGVTYVTYDKKVYIIKQ